MEDLEDGYRAEVRLEDVRAGRDTTHPLAELLAEFA
jgi:hypothetical protein